MTDLYVPLDVNTPDDPKIIEAGDMAELVFYRSLCLAKRLQSNGEITYAQARRLGATPKIIARLTVALWVEIEGGYLIASFLKRNPSREEVKARRKTEAERKAKWREGHKKPATDMSHGTDPTCPTGLSLSDLESDSEREVKPLAPTNGARKPREPDPLFVAVTAACELEVSSLTDTARGALNKALAQLRGVKATPADVPLRAANYHALYPGTSLTPSALAKHWPALARAPQAPQSREAAMLAKVVADRESR